MNNIEKIIGIDLSANAAGMVVMDRTGQVEKKGFITMDSKLHSDEETIYYLSPRVTKTKKREEESKDIFIARRREFVSDCIKIFIHNHCFMDSTLVCLEDYAVAAMGSSTGLLEMAEISGIVRHYLWCNKYRLRLHDPMSVKMWATNNGHAKKVHMVDAARDKGFVIAEEYLKLGSKFADPLQINGKIVTHDYVGPGTDLADAFHLACMGRQELDLKNNEPIAVISYQKKVFERVTKANPIPLLQCPFIYKGDKSDQEN